MVFAAKKSEKNIDNGYDAWCGDLESAAIWAGEPKAIIFFLLDEATSALNSLPQLLDWFIISTFLLIIIVVIMIKSNLHL